ncbi:MAG: hypothetical protein KJ621_03840 [Proteobacteria bacterium]|nr:hypothetical protein [Pseudomonadota bacterium]MBU1742181.1 hypothetical protein [Pseudomonadota bacterium]
MDLKQMFEIAQFFVMRLDGAWFLAAADRLGVQAAWELDVEAWKRFSYVFGKRLARDYLAEPTWPDAFLEAMAIMARILKTEGREVTVNGDLITIRVTDCETQRMIAQAGVADCGIATVASYQGLAKGLFGRDLEIYVEHTKNLNQGDDYCEVLVSREPINQTDEPV